MQQEKACANKCPDAKAKCPDGKGYFKVRQLEEPSMDKKDEREDQNPEFGP